MRKSYSTTEILELKKAIRSGESFTSIAERFSVAYDRSYAGMYVKICNLAKRTRRGRKTKNGSSNMMKFNAKRIEISNTGTVTLYF